jgi:hypothetical protein
LPSSALSEQVRIRQLVGGGYYLEPVPVSPGSVESFNRFFELSEDVNRIKSEIEQKRRLKQAAETDIETGLRLRHQYLLAELAASRSRRVQTQRPSRGLIPGLFRSQEAPSTPTPNADQLRDQAQIQKDIDGVIELLRPEKLADQIAVRLASKPEVIKGLSVLSAEIRGLENQLLSTTTERNSLLPNLQRESRAHTEEMISLIDQSSEFPDSLVLRSVSASELLRELRTSAEGELAEIFSEAGIDATVALEYQQLEHELSEAERRLDAARNMILPSTRPPATGGAVSVGTVTI